ncbi:MAG: hypothetical protein ABR910_03135 [Acidobacteriaceae bacterium]|jgi:hypothetical protein
MGESFMRWKSNGWMLIGLLLAAMSAVGVAQVTTTQVADTIYYADGTPAAGTLIISWPAFTTGSGNSIPSGSTSTVLGTGGALSVQLIPNAGCTPIGSYYTVVYHLDDGSTSQQYWVVPVSSMSIRVSAVENTVLPTSVAMQTVSKSYVDTAIAAAVAGPLDSSAYVLKAGDTMTGPLVLPGDPVSPLQAADMNYVDESVAAVSSGIAQKVSTVPSATQIVAQPIGTQLDVNNLNGAEYASQYVNGRGNNGIANASSGADCVDGCEIVAEQDYTGETFNTSSLNSQTHVKDERGGRQVDSYKNPLDVVNHLLSTGQAVDDVSTQSEVSLFQQTGSQTPGAFGMAITQEGYAGGSNLFPEQIETPPPYFKMAFSALSVKGIYNTQGQHGLVPEQINCYGVGDCLIGSHYIYASGGIRDSADEGAHPFDLQTHEDSLVFAGTCATGCATGSTNVTITQDAGNGTQGDGRFLIDTNSAKVITSASTGGALIGGTTGGPHGTAQFSGTSFPVSVFLSVGQVIPSQSNNMAPGTVTFVISTTGEPSGYATNTATIGSTNGLACVVDQANAYAPNNYEMAPYTVVDATHLQMTLNKPHQILATVAIGGLCGYGLEQTVDTTAGIRQLFPVVGSYSATGVYYAAGNTAVVGAMNQTSGFLNLTAPIASVSRTGSLVTVTTTGALSADVSGLTVTVGGVADSSYNGSFVVTTTGGNSFTYAQSGPNSSSTGGTVSVLTGGFAFYPMAEVLSVYNQANNSVDGQMALAPNNVPWATADPVEEPHYYQEFVSADTEYVGQSVPRPTVTMRAGLQYQQNNGPGLVGWSIQNAAPSTNYFGYGGTHSYPDVAYESTGIWKRIMNVNAGEQAVFGIHCNLHGCANWNSGYNLFELESSVGVDTETFSPQTSSLTMTFRGTPYTFSPSALTAATIDAGTINATTINGALSGASITSGTVAASYLPLFGPSGTLHAPGVVPDPGATVGSTRFLREDGSWTAPPAGGPALPPLVAQPSPSSTTFLQALNNANNVPVHVAAFGDSFLVCDHTNCGPSGGPLVSTNRWLEQVRIQLQGIYGSHGTGVYPVIYGASSSPAVNSEGWSCAGSYDVSTGTLGPSQTTGNALLHLGNGASCTFHDSRNIAWDTLNTYCMTTAASGSIAVSIDSGAHTGTACGTITGSATAHVAALAATASTSHIVTFTSTGDSYLYAAEGQAGSSGVSVDNLGFGGATAAAFGTFPAAQLAFSDLIPGGVQAVIYMDMTNDAASGVASTTFSTNVQSFINHEQSLGSAPTVMLAIPPVDIVNGTDPEAPYTAALSGLCTANSLTCVNIQSRGATVGSRSVGWGTTYDPALFDQTGTAWPTGSQGVHPNDAGNLDEAQMIYAELVNPVNGSGGCASNCTFTGATTLSSSGGSTPALNVTTDDGVVGVLNSTQAGGPFLSFTGTGANVDNWAMGSGGNASSSGGKAFLLGDFTTGIFSWKSTAASTGAGINEFPSLNVHCWSSTASITVNPCDAGISRTGSAALAFGDGTQGDSSASVALGSVAVSGATTNTINSNTNGLALSITSSSSSGTAVTLGGSGSGVHTWGFSSGLGNGQSQFQLGDFTSGIFSFASVTTGSGAGYTEVPSLNVLCWSSTASVTTEPCDTGLSRTAAGSVALGDGTVGDSSGSLSLSNVSANLYRGPATAPSGACSTVGWAFSQDGHATFCNGSTWVTKI